MQISAKILVKKSKYDLDYLPPIRVYLTAEGTGRLRRPSPSSDICRCRKISIPRWFRGLRSKR